MSLSSHFTVRVIPDNLELSDTKHKYYFNCSFAFDMFSVTIFICDSLIEKNNKCKNKDQPGVRIWEKNAKEKI